METLNCIIVDDEPLALENLTRHLSSIKYMKVIAKCKNSLIASEYLKEHKIDVIFLDIQMPGKTGVQLAKEIAKDTMIIFTTAYEKYALESYNLNAIDYILKPIDFDRLKIACDKAFELYSLKNNQKKESGFIMVKSEYQQFKINFSDVVYIEGLKDYVKIYCTNQVKPILSRQNLKTIESSLPNKLFYRVHKSYIVSIDKITSVNKSHLFISNKEIAIGETYKDSFFKKYLAQ